MVLFLVAIFTPQFHCSFSFSSYDDHPKHGSPTQGIQPQLDDAKRLRLYAQSTVSKHQALDASLAKAEAKVKYWKQEAQAGAKKIEQAEKEKDEAKQEAKVAYLATMAAGEAKAREEDELARMQDALLAAEEDGRGLEPDG